MSGYGFDAVYEKPVTICHRQSLVNPPSDTHTPPPLPSEARAALRIWGPTLTHTMQACVYTHLIMYAACSKIDNVSRHTEQLTFCIIISLICESRFGLRPQQGSVIAQPAVGILSVSAYFYTFIQFSVSLLCNC